MHDIKGPVVFYMILRDRCLIHDIKGAGGILHDIKGAGGILHDIKGQVYYT